MDVCNETFDNLNDLKKHIESDHYGVSHKSIKCEKCDKSFNSIHNLKRHVETVHEGLKKYKCDQCDKLFGHGNHLKRHIKSVHENENFECSTCEEAFDSKSALNDHVIKGTYIKLGTKI